LIGLGGPGRQVLYFWRCLEADRGRGAFEESRGARRGKSRFSGRCLVRV
jgi:hypothetical protein